MQRENEQLCKRIAKSFNGEDFCHLMFAVVLLAIVSSVFIFVMISDSDDSYALPDSGNCGLGGTSDLQWEFDGVDTLTITGSGKMENYTPTTAPWYAYINSIHNVVLPDGITRIGDGAFYGCCYLTSVVLPDTVRSIGQSAFQDSGLSYISLPEGLTLIGNNAFSYCTALRAIVIPDSVTQIGNYAFWFTGLMSVILPNGLTTVSIGEFGDCRYLTSVVLPEGLTTLDTVSFYNCVNLTSITLPDSLRTIGERAFNNCARLSSIIIPEGVTTIKTAAFKDCTGLVSAAIPHTISSVGYGVFEGCRDLTSVVIPDETNMVTLTHMQFQDCISLSSIVIPSCVTTVAFNTFGGCTSLSSVTLTGSASHPNKIMSHPSWVSNKLGSMPAAFETIVIDGDVDLSGLSPDASLRLIFSDNVTKDNVTDLSGLVGASDILSDTNLGGSVYKYDFGLSKWVKDSIPAYTVSFDTNGGSQIFDIVALSGSTITLPAPIKTGYVFNGWYVSADLSGSPESSSYSVSEDVTLYAKFTDRSFTISYDPNGGSPSMISPPMSSDTISYAELSGGYTLKSCTFDPPTGMGFRGWVLGFSSLYGENAVLSVDDVNGNVTAYAIWALGVTVSFDSNGGSVIPAKIVACGGTYGSLQTPTKVGYTFNGWYFNGALITSSSVVSTSLDHTLVASWSTVSTPSSPAHPMWHRVNVSFDSTGGSFVNSITVEYRHAYGSLPLPNHPDYVFEGWYLNGVLITSSSIVETYQDHTLTAKWAYQIDVAVSDDNGGVREYTPLIIVFAASALMFMMLLILAYIRRRKDEDE